MYGHGYVVGQIQLSQRTLTGKIQSHITSWDKQQMFTERDSFVVVAVVVVELSSITPTCYPYSCVWGWYCLSALTSVQVTEVVCMCVLTNNSRGLVACVCAYVWVMFIRMGALVGHCTAIPGNIVLSCIIQWGCVMHINIQYSPSHKHKHTRTPSHIHTRVGL